ncbi:hypothetical protein LSH36_28g05012 [Paralvinella palmiformis]|uniref:Uncharacterized protein n=1 Tax=Paralvinella palmiformis TaxID=53620 RepID=A0AAD9NG65_9ANNE|nr:hypothetical protein LSH36_28g05012 [Paralvinella palmiformis]
MFIGVDTLLLFSVMFIRADTLLFSVFIGADTLLLFPVIFISVDTLLLFPVIFISVDTLLLFPVIFISVDTLLLFPVILIGVDALLIPVIFIDVDKLLWFSVMFIGADTLLFSVAFIRTDSLLFSIMFIGVGCTGVRCYWCVYVSKNSDSQSSCSDPWPWYRETFGDMYKPPTRNCHFSDVCMRRGLCCKRYYNKPHVRDGMVGASLEHRLLDDQRGRRYCVPLYQAGHPLRVSTSDLCRVNKIVITNANGDNSVVRTCGSPCNESSSSTTTTTCCHGDLCNHSYRLSPTLITMAATVIVTRVVGFL